MTERIGVGVENSLEANSFFRTFMNSVVTKVTNSFRAVLVINESDYSKIVYPNYNSSANTIQCIAQRREFPPAFALRDATLLYFYFSLRTI